MPRRRMVNKRVKDSKPLPAHVLRNKGWADKDLTPANLKAVFGDDASNVQFFAGTDGKYYPFLPDELDALGRTGTVMPAGLKGSELLGDRSAFKTFTESQLKGAALAPAGAASQMTTAVPLVGRAAGALKNMFSKLEQRSINKAVGEGLPAGRSVRVGATPVADKISGEAAEMAAQNTASGRLKAAFGNALEHPYKTAAKVGGGLAALKVGSDAIGEVSSAVRARTTGKWAAEAQGSLANRQVEIDTGIEKTKQDAIQPQMERSLLAKRVSDLTGQMETERLEKRQQINAMYSPSTAVNLLQMANMLTPPMPESAPLGGGQ